MTIKIELKENELRFLIKLLVAEYHKKNERALHALAHGSDFYDPDQATVVSILDKLEINGK